MDKRQVNIRTSAETAERLKALADHGRITLGVLIEKMLDCYHPDSTILASGDDWRDALDILRAELDERLAAIELATDHNSKAVSDFQIAVNALESRLEALDRGKVALKQKAAVEPSSVLPKESKNKVGQDGERELSPESLSPVGRVAEVDVTQSDEQLSAKDKMIVGLFDSGITNLSEIGRRLKKNGFVTKRNEPIHAANVKRVLIAQKRLPVESKRSR